MTATAPTPTRPTFMEIDLAALDANYRYLKGLLPPGTRVIASVKGNAYGLGIEAVSKRLLALGAPALTTGSFEDALAIRRAGLDCEIVMFGGTLPGGVPDLLEQRLIPTVHNIELAQAISATASEPTKIYIKLDCGLGRLGMALKDARPFIHAVTALPNIVLEGLYTHLPFTNAEEREWAQARTHLFDDFVDSLRAEGLAIPVTQARSSAGILAGIEDRCNAVAPGGLLYGKSPLPADMVDPSVMQPVLKSVRSRLIHVSPDAADKTPGLHGKHAFKVTGATGVVPFGRADGNRAPIAGRTAHMLVNGRVAPVLGVSSEHAVLDLSEVPNPRVGDEVVILGRAGNHAITLGDLAGWQATNGSDILLMMSGRMPRVHRD
ncbi:alanine racemase [Oceanibaculum pacificum]|uniref:alanine racemase n=1 Tax=Oceanibaculum pacificum TaxID=580166 RepID=A0A154W8E8_9PROT|nr:alanine racemase [Oceanibaculum pacificum]KZD09733.1 hypothetical protein AUP43_06695 [Oceanibaculum pacificum]